jgi:aspartate racemase
MMIGILAGMGPHSTAPFIQAVIDQCQKIFGASLDEEFPRMMILSLPTPFYIDRSIDHNKMKDIIIGGLQQLESTGVDFISMPCNSAHAYYDELASSINIPLLNIISITLSNLRESGRTTLLCTRGTMDSGLYQDGFERANLDFHFRKDWQDRIDQMISLIKAGDIKHGAANIWSGILKDLEHDKVHQAVIACTDINAVLPFVRTGINLVDSSEALAVATVQKYIEGTR